MVVKILNFLGLSYITTVESERAPHYQQVGADVQNPFVAFTDIAERGTLVMTLVGMKAFIPLRLLAWPWWRPGKGKSWDAQL